MRVMGCRERAFPLRSRSSLSKIQFKAVFGALKLRDEGFTQKDV
jgi:hypothetical protein